MVFLNNAHYSIVGLVAPFSYLDAILQRILHLEPSGDFAVWYVFFFMPGI